MSTQITLTLSDKQLERAVQLSHTYQQDVASLMIDLLEQAHLKVVPTSHHTFNQDEADWAEPDEEVEKTQQAYLAMYPDLKKKFWGKYVAIYKDQFVDFDTDFDALYDRIDEKYPDEFVWLTKIGEEPIPTINVRSPRIEKIG